LTGWRWYNISITIK